MNELTQLATIEFAINEIVILFKHANCILLKFDDDEDLDKFVMNMDCLPGKLSFQFKCVDAMKIEFTPSLSLFFQMQTNFQIFAAIAEKMISYFF